MITKDEPPNLAQNDSDNNAHKTSIEAPRRVQCGQKWTQKPRHAQSIAKIFAKLQPLAQY